MEFDCLIGCVFIKPFVKLFPNNCPDSKFITNSLHEILQITILLKLDVYGTSRVGYSCKNSDTRNRKRTCM